MKFYRCVADLGSEALLGGSWVVGSGVITGVTISIIHDR